MDDRDKERVKFLEDPVPSEPAPVRPEILMKRLVLYVIWNHVYVIFDSRLRHFTQHVYVIFNLRRRHFTQHVYVIQKYVYVV